MIGSTASTAPRFAATLRLRALKGDLSGGFWSITRRLYDKNPRPRRRSRTPSWLCPDRWGGFRLSRRRASSGSAGRKAQKNVGGQGIRWRRRPFQPVDASHSAGHPATRKSPRSAIVRLQSLQGSQPYRAHVQSHQTVSTHRHALRQDETFIREFPQPSRRDDLDNGFCQRNLASQDISVSTRKQIPAACPIDSILTA